MTKDLNVDGNKPLARELAGMRAQLRRTLRRHLRSRALADDLADGITGFAGLVYRCRMNEVRRDLLKALAARARSLALLAAVLA
ncbi:MAG TPA: hypothetical protein VJV75_03690, partial [Candidatus Polarisedimenticolia bacterium]|nr:hypothetical protein [Candidatus Polarisedimenticolia bacterium]